MSASVALSRGKRVIKQRDIIMSDSEHSTITYLTELEYSDMGSPGVDGPPSPDYIPGPEAPPSPDYVPGPEAPPSPISYHMFGARVPELCTPEDHVFLLRSSRYLLLFHRLRTHRDIFPSLIQREIQRRRMRRILRRTLPTILLTLVLMDEEDEVEEQPRLLQIYS
ncbi:hypothetical protein Tco_0098470 [Tanacetum coccineum]